VTFEVTIPDINWGLLAYSVGAVAGGVIGFEFMHAEFNKIHGYPPIEPPPGAYRVFAPTRRDVLLDEPHHLLVFIPAAFLGGLVWPVTVIAFIGYKLWAAKAGTAK
jgi:hypothetical protein